MPPRRSVFSFFFLLRQGNRTSATRQRPGLGERGKSGRKEKEFNGVAFTLVEVLVALAIFVMMAIVLGSAYLNVLNAYELAARSAQRDEDVRFARATLLAEADRDKAEEGGEFTGENGRKVAWRATIEQAPVADLFEVTFRCELNAPEMKKPEVVEEVFRLLRPTWSEAAERDKLRAAARTRIMKLQVDDGK
jgi:general secretion pathway protein I